MFQVRLFISHIWTKMAYSTFIESWKIKIGSERGSPRAFAVKYYE